MAEKILPGENGSAIRVIIPGGDKERRYLYYDDEALALRAQGRYQRRWTPNFLAKLLDEGMRTGEESVADYPTDEHQVVGVDEQTLMRDTVSAWRNGQLDQHEEIHHAA